ncbi:MAG: peroxiredoxin [Planctomycetota bacterium]
MTDTTDRGTSVHGSWTPPRLHERAPDFTARSTQGEVALHDFEGRWLVFFSHPADFTPVCTTELIAFAEHRRTFRELGVEVLGLSQDSLYSHIAWLRAIEDKFAIKVEFPLISDPDLSIAHRYGMVDVAGDGGINRTVVIIDPEQHVRAYMAYPSSTGRSVDEVLRLLTALQFSEQKERVTPEGWRPGDKSILPAPATWPEAEERVLRNPGNVDWYFTLKDSAR